MNRKWKSLLLLGALTLPLAAYTPNPADPNNPISTTPASSAYQEFQSLKQYIQNLLGNTGGGIGNASVVGAMYMPGDIFFASSTGRPGAIVCDGSAVSRTTYAVLFAAIGTTFGPGDGSTTFNVPNLIGKNPSGATIAGSTGGSLNATLTAANIPTITSVSTSTVTDPGHVHTITDPGHTHLIGANVVITALTTSGSTVTGGSGYDAQKGSVTVPSNTTGISINSHTTGITVGTTTVYTNASPTAVNVTNPYITLVPYIKT